MALRSMLGLAEPHTFELADQRLATVMTSGDLKRVADPAVAALYASVNAAREKRPFDLEPLRARWPLAQPRGRGKSPAMWGLPIPSDVADLPQVDEEYAVRAEIWEYGTVAEILHEGSRAEEGRTVDRLHRWVDDQGLEPIGPFEEEYLTPPGAPVPKTLIRFRVRQR